MTGARAFGRFFAPFHSAQNDPLLRRGACVVYVLWVLALACLAGEPTAGKEARPAKQDKCCPRDHHTAGDTTYTDTNGDGVVDHEVTLRGDGTAVVKEDGDLDGSFDTQYEVGADGAKRNETSIQEPAPRLADVRAESRGPKEWFLLGFPIGTVAAIFAVPLLLVLAVIVLWRFTRTTEAVTTGRREPPGEE
jgi:hypothetical protein